MAGGGGGMNTRAARVIILVRDTSSRYISHNCNYYNIQKGFNWWVSFAPEFQCSYFCESSCLFYLSFNFDFYVSKIMHL